MGCDSSNTTTDNCQLLEDIYGTGYWPEFFGGTANENMIWYEVETTDGYQVNLMRITDDSGDDSARRYVKGSVLMLAPAY